MATKDFLGTQYKTWSKSRMSRLPPVINTLGALPPNPHHLGALWMQGPSSTTPSSPPSRERGWMGCPGLGLTKAVVILVLTEQLRAGSPTQSQRQSLGSRKQT